MTEIPIILINAIPLVQEILLDGIVQEEDLMLLQIVSLIVLMESKQEQSNVTMEIVIQETDVAQLVK